MTRDHSPSDREAALAALRALPGIGSSLALDLYSVGVRSTADLRRRDPAELYARLERTTGRRQDPCVLYAFRCAAYAVRAARPERRLLDWWAWRDLHPADDGRPVRTAAGRPGAAPRRSRCRPRSRG